MTTSTSGVAVSAEHRTVGRVMTILELVVASGERGLRLGDLATALAAPKSSLHALTKGLVATGYLREEDNRYMVGPAISGLMNASAVSAPFAYRHILTAVAERWGETTMLSTLIGDSVVYLDAVEPDVFIRAIPVLNRRLVLWPRSSGRVFLAAMEERKLESYIRRHHQDAAEAEYVRSEVAETRETHVGLNIGATVADHIGIAVPIFSGSTQTNLALAIAGPRSRMEDRVEAITADLLSAAQTRPE